MHGEYNIFALYVMYADGSHVRQISQPIFGDAYTIYSWSSDGKYIAISDVNTSHIDIIDVARGSTRNLITSEESNTFYWCPDWQPVLQN